MSKYRTVHYSPDTLCSENIGASIAVVEVKDLEKCSYFFPTFHVFGCKASSVFMKVIENYEDLDFKKKYELSKDILAEHYYMKELNSKEADKLFIVK